MLGLSSAAWVIVLTAFATYIALASAWLLAIPAQRAAILQGNITAIEVELSQDPQLRETQEKAIQIIKRRTAQRAKTDRRLIRRGITLLILSFLIFSAAVVVQTRTDEAFHGHKGAQTSAPKS